MRLITLLLVLAGLIITGSAHAASDRVRVEPSLAPLWERLDLARQYRADFVLPGGSRAKSYRQLLEAYRSVTSVPGLGGKSPRQEFQDLLAAFRVELDAPLAGVEAEWGAQEALNEIMAGQALLGNDALLSALRARFPGVNEGQEDPLALLEDSESEFQVAIDLAVEQLRTLPESLRAGGGDTPPNLDFPFYVENATDNADTDGELVENEFYRFTELVYRQALAANTRAKKKFFFENERDVGRAEAAQLAKDAAQQTYLHAIVLASVQSPDTFQQNNGHEFKRQVVDAQRLLEDIQSGFNPLELRGDFIPPGEVGALGFICNANVLISGPNGAVSAEAAVENFNRDVDQLETALRDSLQQQQQTFIEEISAITGIPITEIKPEDLIDPQQRAELLAEAEVRMLNGEGELGAAYLDIEQAAISARALQAQINQIPERIRLEEDTTGEINRINLRIAAQRGALELAMAIANAVEVCTCGVASGTTNKVGEVAAAGFKGAFQYFEALQRAEIQDSITSKRVHELLLEQAILLISLEGAQAEIEARKALLDRQRARLERLIRGYVSGQANLAKAYFNNPAYRLQRDSAEEEAEANFEDAMVAAYYAAKALEYEWAERFQNPVERTDGGIPVALGATFEPFVRSESAFAVRSAGAEGAPQPGLDDFMGALEAWDLQLRQSGFRNPSPGQDSVTWSLRRDILGFDSGDDEFDLLRFRDFIAAHRVPGTNPDKDDLLITFPVQIGDNSLLPGFLANANSAKAPNIKLTGIGLNLRPIPLRSLIESGGGALNPPQFTVELRDSSLVRTFFARVGDDDLLTVDLPGSRGLDLEQAHFNSLVTATLDAPASNIVMDDGLRGLSPAVSKWVLRLDMGALRNEVLLLENLADIEIKIDYRYGRADPLGSCPAI